MAQEFSHPNIASLKDFELTGDGNGFTTWRAFSNDLGKTIEVISAKSDSDQAYASHVAYVSSLFVSMNHPSLAEIYEVGKADSCPFIIQETPSGKSLADIVNTSGPLNEKNALTLALQISEALAYATAQSEIVIRNLKPQNIYIGDDGVAKITDFRYAVIARDPTHGPVVDGDNIIGTPSFISPEQAEGSPYADSRADMYALGTILYFLLLGITPFDGMDSMDILDSQRTAQIANPRELNKKLSTETTALITRLLVKNPDMRYETWSDVVSEIKNILNGKKCSRLAPGAVSTIAPLPGETQFAETAPDLFTAKREGKPAAAEQQPQSKQPQPTNPFAEQKKDRASGWKFILWLILMLWFTFLVNCRMKNPMHLPSALAPEFSIPVLDKLTDMIAGKNTQEEQAVEPIDDSKPTAATAVASGAPAAENAKASPLAKESASPAAAKSPPSPREITQSEMEAILARLREGDIRAADKAARAFASTPTGKEISEFLAKTDDVEKTLGDVIMARRGKSITISFKGKDRTVVPETLVNDNLTVTGTRNDGEKFDLVLKLSQFSDAEKLKLLSNYATTEHHHITAAALALKLGDTESFKTHAGSTGPLAPVFSLAQ